VCTQCNNSRDILLEKKNGVATITFNRPEVYNSYSTQSLRHLACALQDASFDDSIAAIVLTGFGTRAFCTGGDVKEYNEIYTKQPHEYWKYMAGFRAAVEGVLRSGKPTIARLNGMAVGGGNEFNLACDLSIIAEHAYVGQVGTSVGSVACGGATQWLPITVGAKRAAEMLFLNYRIPARKALEWGLVNDVVPSVKHKDTWVNDPSPQLIDKAQRKEDGYSIDLSELDARVAQLCEGIKDKFPECMRYTKTQLNYWKQLVWDQTVAHAQDWLSLHFASREPYEGMRSFVEKRKPDYRGIRAALSEGKAPELLYGPLSRECSSCGAASLPESFEYCGRCGAKLAASPIEARK
jgi:enoyl-CoA hydratase/carnithine racemase